jgi:hypothetical protein
MSWYKNLTSIDRRRRRWIDKYKYSFLSMFYSSGRNRNRQQNIENFGVFGFRFAWDTPPIPPAPSGRYRAEHQVLPGQNRL